MTTLRAELFIKIVEIDKKITFPIEKNKLTYYLYRKLAISLYKTAKLKVTNLYIASIDIISKINYKFRTIILITLNT